MGKLGVQCPLPQDRAVAAVDGECQESLPVGDRNAVVSAVSGVVPRLRRFAPGLGGGNDCACADDVCLGDDSRAEDFLVDNSRIIELPKLSDD